MSGGGPALGVRLAGAVWLALPAAPVRGQGALPHGPFHADWALNVPNRAFRITIDLDHYPGFGGMTRAVDLRRSIGDGTGRLVILGGNGPIRSGVLLQDGAVRPVEMRDRPHGETGEPDGG